MKRTAVKTVITVLLLVFAAGAYANPYFLVNKVYAPDGSIGTTATANSYAGFAAFRQGIPGEIGKENSGPIDPERIYQAYYNNLTAPAYAFTDVGSSDWITAPALGQVVTGVMQVYPGQFGWSGGSYMACTLTTISADNISGSETDLTDLTLKQIPAPAFSGAGPGYIDIGWTGMDMDLVAGYTVYRSTSLSGTYTAISYTAAQNRNAGVVFTDNSVIQGDTYFYKIAVNVAWGGGNGAPDYFVTDARSDASAGIYCGSTPTITPSMTGTIPSMTVTPSCTETMTPTFTPTYSATYTDTETHTPTGTDTATDTVTVTPSATVTATDTITMTFTLTLTALPTATTTLTPVPPLYTNIAAEKLVILNSPIKDGRLKLGIFAEAGGNVILYAFNVAGELVYKETLPVAAGPNLFDREFRKARGIYILRAVVKTNSNISRLPLKKFAVVKNNY